MDRKRILVITDSVGLPRPRLGIRYKDTYLCGLEANETSLWVFSRGGANVTEVLERLDNLASYINEQIFDAGIVHIGLVDCVPRPIPQPLRQKIDKLPYPIRAPIVAALHYLRPFIQSKVGYYQITPMREYTIKFDKLARILQTICKTVVVISIAPVTIKVQKHSPSIEKEIAVCNAEMRKVADKYGWGFINLDLLLESNHLTDDAHINAEAHTLILKELKQFIKMMSGYEFHLSKRQKEFSVGNQG